MADNTDTVTWLASVWTKEKGRRIASTTSDGQTSTLTYLTKSQYGDYKPITPPDGSKIAFLMNPDGTDVKELTDDTYFNGNLHWTRDGTNRITWFRIVNDTGEPLTYSKVKIWRTSWDAVPGEEEITEQNYKSLIWYTSFSPDDKRILYTVDGKVFEYNIESGTHRKVSTDDSVECRYPSYLGSVK